MLNGEGDVNMEGTGNYLHMVSALLPSGQNITYHTATSFTAPPQQVLRLACNMWGIVWCCGLIG